MTEYPILVERLDPDLAAIIGCNTCGKEDEILSPEEGLPADGEFKCGYCGGIAVFKYEEAEKCPNCGTLGFYGDFPYPEHSCSRVCHLQYEYAQQLHEV